MRMYVMSVTQAASGSATVNFRARRLGATLGGTDGAYQQGLFAAVKRAAAPGTMTVLRSFKRCRREFTGGSCR